VDHQRTIARRGYSSIALGAIEMIAAGRVARALRVPEHDYLVRMFGAREIATGANLLQDPDSRRRMLSRLGGDALDMAALGVAAWRSPRNRLIWGALAVAVGVTVLDAILTRTLTHQS